MFVPDDRRPSGEATSPPDSTTAPAEKRSRAKRASASSKPKAPKERKYALADTIKADFNLSRPARELGVYLAGLVDLEEVFVFASHARIGKKLGMSDRTVRRRARELQDAGYFERQLRASAWHGNHYHPQFTMIAEPKDATEPAAPSAGGSSGTSFQNRYQVPQNAANNDRTCGQKWPHHVDKSGRTMRPKVAAILQGDTSGDFQPTSELQKADNGEHVADAPALSVCAEGASLRREEPALPEGIPLPGYDSKTFIKRLPSFATTWPEEEKRPWIPPDEVNLAYDLVADAWQGEEGDAHRATSRLMMRGWTPEQLIAPMFYYHDEMQKLQTSTMRLYTYLEQEFDVSGQHVTAWEAEKADKAELRRLKDEAPAIIERPVVEHQAEPVTIAEPAEPVVEQPVAPVVAEGKAKACDDDSWYFGDDDCVETTGPVRQIDPEEKARLDAMAAMTPAEQRAFMVKAAKEVRAKFEADRIAKETPSERREREAREHLTKIEKERAESKRNKLAADRASKPASAPASRHPLPAPRGIDGGIRRMGDYADATF